MDVVQQHENRSRESRSSNTGNHDAHTQVGGVRKCWATARERNRMKARYAIQQRVFCANNKPADIHEAVLQEVPLASNTGTRSNSEKITQILHRIIRGDTSHFSLQFMEEHFDVLNDPFPSQFLWETNHVTTSQSTKEQVFLDAVRLRSRLGRDSLSELADYASDIDTCTILEYAVWLKRFRIIRQLIIGGIDPIHCRSNKLSVHQYKRAKEIGIRVRQLFLSGIIPLSLSCYVVARVIGLRQSTWSEQQSTQVESMNSLENSVKCMICGVSTDLLRYSSPSNSSEDQCHSLHSFCEICIWNDILKHLDHREGDVVKCPICQLNSALKEDKTDPENSFSSERIETRRQFYNRSLTKYNDLPIDSATIKKIANKKKTPPERETVCSNWSDAVKPFIGLTQTSRREKFFQFVEKGSYHHVKACINQGIDLNLHNEYGQTAFFIAVWQNNVPMAQLLFHYGCDPYIVANGNISPYSVGKICGYKSIIDLLDSNESTKCAIETRPALPNDESYNIMQLSSATVTSLIDLSVDHPGAGSFIIDDFLESSFVDALFNLWKTLPEEPVAKTKNGPCSERRYYCDSHSIISKKICAVLMDTITADCLPFEQVLCGPFMRFLNYSESGAVLAPHIDLSRTDPTTTQRSTHSFLLYLSTCRRGGETALLGSVTGDGRNQCLAAVAPKRGRILIFPHRCPHEGLVVIDTPKMLIRGELWIS